MEQFELDITSGKCKLKLEDAKRLFRTIALGLEEKNLDEFLEWAATSADPKLLKDSAAATVAKKKHNSQRKKLVQIAKYMKEQRLCEANETEESDSWKWPETGFDSDCKPSTTVHINSFLYTDEDIDGLVEKGEFSRTYCSACGSRKTQPLQIISHSLNRNEIEFIFTKLMPPDVSQVLDIGSRTGAVLFGASIFSEGKVRGLGVEINEGMVKIAKDTAAKFNLQNVDFVADDFRMHPNMIRESQMVVINNVFSFFQTIKDQEDCWEFLHKNLTPGTTLILHPTIDEATSHLNLSFDPFEWIELCDTSKECNDFAGDDEEMFDDAAAMYKYIVRGSS